MLSQNFFSDPEIVFGYVNDYILWEKIWLRPFTIIGEKRTIKLYDYFTVGDRNVITPKNEVRQRKILKPVRKFAEAKQNERDLAFIGLCEFLIKYGRRHRDCYIKIPNHHTMVPNPKFQPLDAYYKIPAFPCIDRNTNMLSITFTERFFPEVFRYIFGYEEKITQNTEIFFPPAYFRGFILQN